MSYQPRRAFTFLELIVVLCVLGFFAAMLSPSLQHSQEQENQMRCSNNIRYLGQAMASYESKKQRYPGYLNVFKKIDNSTTWTTPGTDTKQGASWAVLLMPFMELDMQYNQLRVLQGDPRKGLMPVEWFVCPSLQALTKEGSFLCYAANAGCRDVQTATRTIPRDWADNGVFMDRYSDDPASGAVPGLYIASISSSNIKDGTGNTLMLAENADGGQYDDYVEELLAITWDPTSVPDMSTSPPTVKPVKEVQRINHDTGGRASRFKDKDYKAPAGGINKPTSLADYARPSSTHVGGVNVIYCDTHTGFLSEDIDYYVYGLLMSSNGRGVKKPGSQTAVLNWNRPIAEDWLKPDPKDK